MVDMRLKSINSILVVILLLLLIIIASGLSLSITASIRQLNSNNLSSPSPNIKENYTLSKQDSYDGKCVNCSPMTQIAETLDNLPKRYKMYNQEAL